MTLIISIVRFKFYFENDLFTITKATETDLQFRSWSLTKIVIHKSNNWFYLNIWSMNLMKKMSKKHYLQF